MGFANREIAVYRKLTKKYPGNDNLRLALAESLAWRLYVGLDTHVPYTDETDRSEMHRECVAIIDALPTSEAAMEVLCGLANNRVGTPSGLEAIELANKRVTSETQRLNVRRILVRCLSGYADGISDPAEAAPYFQRAIKIHDELLAHDPSALSIFAGVQLYDWRSQNLRKLGDEQAADRASARSQELLDRLETDIAESSQVWTCLERHYHWYAEIEPKNPTSAVESFRKAIKYRELLVKYRPSYLNRFMLHARLHEFSGKLAQVSQFEDAIDAGARSIAIAERLFHENPVTYLRPKDHAAGYIHHAGILRYANEHDRAKRMEQTCDQTAR